MFNYVLIVVLGYLFGSISSSILLSRRLYNTDIRTRGSGNAGATNVARVFGFKSGLLTFGCDACKTVAAMLIGLALGGDNGLALAGAACLIGHCWPVFFKFKGGKGVTVGAVIALMIDWRVFLIGMVGFFLLFALSQIVSVSSMGGAVLLATLSFAFGCSLPRCLLAVFTAVLVIFQHRSNIVRLLHHTEPKFRAKAEKKNSCSQESSADTQKP